MGRKAPRSTTATWLVLPPLLTLAAAMTVGQAPLPASGTGRPSVASGLKHVVAIRTDGTVVTWGENEVGQLGRGTTDAVNVRRPPDAVPGITTAIAASAGDDFTVLLLADGTVLSWGDNAEGQLGHGPMGVLPRPGQPMRPVSTPGPVVGLTGVTQVAAGARFALALREDGSVVAWGDGQLGALGDGKGVGGTSHYAVPFPRPIAGLSNVTAIAAGASFALALRDDGSVWGWGASRYGQLGDSRSEFVATPVPLPAMGPARSVHAAGDTALALRTDGTVVAWGKNDGGLLDVAESKLPRSPTPVPILGLAGVRQLATSSMAASVLAVMPDGGVRAWGDNAYSQISNGPVVDGKVVVPVTGVAAVATGGARSLFVMPDGRVLSTGFRMADLVDRVPREVARLDPAADTRCAVPAGGPAGAWGFVTDVVTRAQPASKADVTAALARAAGFERLLTVLPADATLNESRGRRFIRDATPALGNAMAYGVRGQFLLSRCEAGSGRLEEIGSTRSVATIVANDLAGLLDTFGPPLPLAGGEIQLYQMRRQDGTVGGWPAFRTSQGRAVLVTRAGDAPVLAVSRREFLEALERHVLARSAANAGAMTGVVTQMTQQIAQLRTEPQSETRDTIIAQMEKALADAKQQTAANAARVEVAAGNELAALRRYRENAGAGDLARPAVLSAFAFQGQFADGDAEGARPIVRLNPDYFTGRPRHQAQVLLVVWDWAAGHPQDEAWRSWFESAFPFDRLQGLLAP